MFSAASEVRYNEDTQDDRIYALEQTGVTDEARLLVLEQKTQHQEGESDHTRHGRRLQATDRITVDSTADLDHATLEAISANTHDASLKLVRGTTGSETVLSHEALSGNTTMAVAGNTVLSVSQSSGSVTLGSGVGVTLSGNAVVQPDASIATLTLVGPTNTDDAAINMTHGTSNTGWRLEAGASSSEFRITRDNGGSHDVAVRLDGVGNTTLKGLDNRIEGEENDNSVLALTERVTGNANNFGVGIRYNGAADKGQLVAYDGVSSNIQAPDATVVEWQRGGNLLSLMNSPAGFAGTTTIGNGSVQTSATTYCVLDCQGTATQGVRLPNTDTTNTDIMCVGGLDGSVVFDTGRDRLAYKGSGTAARVVADSGTSQVGYLPINHNMTLRSTPVTGFVGSTTTWTTLSGASYPTLTLTVQANDLIRLSGQFVEDHTNYAFLGNFYRLVAKRGSSIGTIITNLDQDHVLCSAGGDNSTEYGNVTWPGTTHLITASDAGLLWIGWQIKRRTTDTVTLVAEGTASQKQVSTVQVEHLRRVTLPTV
jgi:hypothetical protein